MERVEVVVYLCNSLNRKREIGLLPSHRQLRGQVERRQGVLSPIF